MSGNGGGTIGGVVGAVVGGVIGFYSGNVWLGVQYGWAIGSTVGAVVDPEKVEGPRLQERAVQASSYGRQIPIIYGGDAVAGNVIWATDLQETAEESGGKGGPEVTTYSYSVSCAILISEGEQPGLRRIWADAKLVYDASEEADEATKAATFAFSRYLTFYPGSEDQLPDPTMEALIEGDVTAYRGYCYVVFTDLPLGDYGNRLPNFRFEIGQPIEDASSSDAVVYEPLKIYPWTTGARPVHSVGETEYWMYGSGDDQTSRDYDEARGLLWSHPTAGYTGPTAPVFLAYRTSVNNRLSFFPETMAPARVDDDQNDVEFVHYEMGITPPDVVSPYYNRGDFLNFNYGAWGDSMKQAGCLFPAEDARTFYSIDNEYATYSRLTRVNTAPDLAGFVTINSYVYTSNVANWGVVWGSKTETLRAERVPAPPPDTAACPVGSPEELGVPVEMPDNPCFCIDALGNVTPNQSFEYTVVSGTFKQLSGIFYSGGLLVQNALGPVLPEGHPDYNNDAFWAAAREAALADGSLHPDYAWATPTGADEVAMGVASSGCEVQTAAEVNTTLGAIVADVCRRCGMPDGTYDVGALYGVVVQGYTIGRQMEGRAALVPLQMAFWWDFVESGEALKAVLRGTLPIATIGADELGAVEGESPAIRVAPNRAQESELPAEVTVTYPVRATGYEAGTQRARRITSGSQQALAIESAVVMTDDHAAQMADVLMYTAWTNRTTRKFATTRRYARMEPTDVLTVNDGEFSHLLRIVERVESGPVIEWTAVDERPAAYAPTVTGAPVGDGVGPLRYDGPMRLVLLDAPLLRDADDGAGHYAAGAGYLPTWASGVAFRSYDDGGTYAAAQAINVRATIGTATTALGDFAGGGNMVDERNSVTVRLLSGTLATITQAALLNNGNAAMLGAELIQFKRAELVSTGIYRLTGLLRGRRGTEQHMGTHAVDDTFVLLDPANVYRIASGVDELDAPAVWKGVSRGQSLADAFEVDFTNTGVGIKPLAPTHLHAVPIGGGEYRVSWVRRTRIGGKWRDGVDVPLGEASESYRVEVLASEVVQSTVTTSASTVDVSADPGDTIRVRQISALVGPGFPATITAA